MKPYTVTELTLRIKEILESNFPEVWVEGEVSNYKVSTNGHAFFKLKDERSLINSVIWRSNLQKIKFNIEDGQQLIVKGYIDVFEPQGLYQLVIETVEPVGVGALQRAFEELKKKLQEEGLFDEKYKKPIPVFPQKIAVVTSPTGAAIRDILNILKRRFANIQVVIYPVLVQGKEAAEQIATAINDLNRLKNCEVIILARGGGSLEDLWPFNEEIVARAIFDCDIPIISAVGHETDYTISDFVADLRAPTPSAAAELVVKNKQDVIEKLAGLHRYLHNTVRYKISTLKTKVEQLIQRPVIIRPYDKINQLSLYIDTLHNQFRTQIDYIFESMNNRYHRASALLLQYSPQQKLARAREMIQKETRTLRDIIVYRHRLIAAKVTAITEKLAILNPLAILERGYSISYTYPEKKIVKTIEQLQCGKKVSVRVAQGEFIATVEQLHRS
ncbi:MAG: exodeoxyribonuclease VII large subunit [bacterium]|nr:exodeoxyribonuclease VII large subunit [bacterium]